MYTLVLSVKYQISSVRFLIYETYSVYWPAVTGQVYLFYFFEKGGQVYLIHQVPK